MSDRRATAAGAAKLNFETLKLGQFTLTVTVVDSGFTNNAGVKQGAQTAKSAFTVRVADVNEAPTGLTFQAAPLPSGALPLPAGFLLGTCRPSTPTSPRKGSPTRSSRTS